MDIQDQTSLPTTDVGVYAPLECLVVGAGLFYAPHVPNLCVNIDHVATIRQARRTWEPDPVAAAILAQEAGAAGITFHLREDRRHIQDGDLQPLKDAVSVRLNMEMAATDEMIDIAIGLQPDIAMLVPEKRAELTTEGGLDVASSMAWFREVVSRLKDGGIPASAFIDADIRQIDAACEVGFDVCEVHTGPWSHCVHDSAKGIHGKSAAKELAKVASAGKHIQSCDMQFNAGHALNYQNIQPIAALKGLHELHIGHSIISRAVLSGMPEAVTTLNTLIQQAQNAKVLP